MNTFDAFAMGMANRGKELMVFDWDKAARIIKERKPESAAAGLRGDWEYTGGVIFEDGKPCKNDYTYLSSTWAVPELSVDGDVIPCYKMQSEVPRWGCDTKWPKSALDMRKPMRGQSSGYIPNTRPRLQRRANNGPDYAQMQNGKKLETYAGHV